MSELRELREECRRLGCHGWRKWSELRLRRFKLRRRDRATEVHSLDLETLEPLGPQQRRFVWTTPGHRFVFEPLQLMRYFDESGEFRNPLTRAPITDRQLRRLCRACGRSEDLVERRDEITARKQRTHLLLNVARLSWDEMLAQPSRERLSLWCSDMKLLREHDHASYLSFLRECVQTEPLWFLEGAEGSLQGTELV